MRRIIALAAALLLLCGCQAPPSAEPTPTPVVSPSPTPVKYDGSTGIDWSNYNPSGNGSVTIRGETFQTQGRFVVESSTDLDLDAITASDLGNYFVQEYPVERQEYSLLAGTEHEICVYVINGQEEGPCVYVVSGIHGDERAGWYAGTLIQQASIAAGTLYVIAPANVTGAHEGSRYVTASQDLNRSFPGNADGTAAERIANAIFQDVSRVQPDLVFDLHEARALIPGSDFLGSTVIYSILDGIDELFFDLMLATDSGELCSEPFGYTGPGPEGSINNTVSYQLGIPVLTVETFRGYEMARRVGDQLSIVQFALESLGML